MKFFFLDSDFLFGTNAPCQLLRFNFKNCSLIFLITISRLNCPPLPDIVLVELHRESWIERASDAIYLRVYFFNV